MKQCEPLKEPLNVPKECAPYLPGLRNHRSMPMEHVGIVTSDPVAGASDLVAVDVRTQEQPKVFMNEEKANELSIEEKAKRYDEAIEKLRSLHDDYDTVSTLIDIKEELENIFPEFAESEDERIRKAMIDFFKYEREEGIAVLHYGVNIERMIAWLEKQGEQNLANSAKTCKDEKPTVIIPKFRVGDEIKTSNEESLTITKIDEKGYWSEDLFICNFDDTDKWELVGYNPTWSEEDGNVITSIIAALSLFAKEKDAEGCFDTEITWLKSLRPQKYVGYNPYKATVESIAEMCKHYDVASHSGLRDFYDNVKVKCKDAKEYDSLFPQNTWKPSYEQMNKLCWIAKQNKDNMIGKELMTLYQDLKNLRKE